MIREAQQNDLEQILNLYLDLHEKEIPSNNEHLRNTWQQISDDKNHHLIVCEIDGRIVSSCVFECKKHSFWLIYWHKNIRMIR